MSDVHMDTPESSTMGMTHTRSAKPELYFGDRAKLETWILQFDRYFHLEGERIDDIDKVMLATTYMRGDAEKWVIPIVRTYMDPALDTANSAIVESWDNFKAKLRQVFSPIKELLVAKQKIQTLQQNKSAADYTTLFQRYAEPLDWNDGALIEMYKQGLKPVVRQELMRSGATTETLDQLINEAIRIDNDLYELKLEEQAYSARSRLNGREPRETKVVQNQGRRQFRPNQGQRRFNPRPQIAGYYQSKGLESMHLGTIHQGKPKKSYDNNSGKRDKPTNKDCYNCGKPGHFARDCRMKNKVVRQLNMLSKRPQGQEPTEEWTVVQKEEQVLADTASRRRTKKIQQMEGAREQLAETRQMIQEAKDTLALNQIFQKINGIMDLPYDGSDDEEISAAREPETYDQKHLVQRNELPTTEFHEAESDDEELQNILEPYNDKLEELLTELWTAKHEAASARRGRTSQQPSHDGPAKRPQTPHPGRRVKGPWDNNTKERYPEDRALTPEELAIHTPPASPKLVRRSATLRENSLPPSKERRARTKEALVNDGQALAIYQKDWTTFAEAEYQRVQVKHQTPMTARYLDDPRNLQHGKLSWIACTHDDCRIHIDSKKQAAYFPRPSKSCKWRWYECKRISCPDHLFDKRQSGYFYGITDEDATNPITDNHPCQASTWQLCIHPHCTKHESIRKANGYGTDESFLGQHPGAATPSVLRDSSDLQ
jgi:hypothetical protein